ncbi:MAG: energy transducer TonB [Acidobacteria bacterium]|nr:energy transducer TonB [Acidobacteriota bacterium]
MNTVVMVEPSLVKTAVSGFKYDGSLNLTVAQARDLGAAIGCDYFLLGRARLSPRSLAPDQIIYRAWLGLFLVDARSGKLAHFEFLEHQHSNSDQASHALLTELESRLPNDLDGIHQRLGDASSSSEPRSQNIIEINNPQGQTRSVALEPPRILISSKPVYTKAARTADVTATVELEVTFLPEGTIGPIEVVRWAGFGLDESAIDVARKLKFRPAKLNGQPVACRALVQYKFQLKDSPPGAATF